MRNCSQPTLLTLPTRTAFGFSTWFCSMTKVSREMISGVGSAAEDNIGSNRIVQAKRTRVPAFLILDGRKLREYPTEKMAGKLMSQTPKASLPSTSNIDTTTDPRLSCVTGKERTTTKRRLDKTQAQHPPRTNPGRARRT